MNRGDIQELENCIFDSLERMAPFGRLSKAKAEYLANLEAAILIANIIGVLIDLKPTAVLHLDEKSLEYISIGKFENQLNKLGLRVLIDISHSLQGTFGKDEKDSDQDMGNRIEHQLNVFASKDIKLAKQAHDIFYRCENCDWRYLDEEWAKANREIGEILGYPKTAVDYYIDLYQKGQSEEEKKAIEKGEWPEWPFYCYYMHSMEHKQEEYDSYDLKLKSSLIEYAPRTAKIVSCKYIPNVSVC